MVLCLTELHRRLSGRITKDNNKVMEQFDLWLLQRRPRGHTQSRDCHTENYKAGQIYQPTHTRSMQEYNKTAAIHPQLKMRRALWAGLRLHLRIPHIFIYLTSLLRDDKRGWKLPKSIAGKTPPTLNNRLSSNVDILWSNRCWSCIRMFALPHRSDAHLCVMDITSESEKMLCGYGPRCLKSKSRRFLHS